MEILRSKFSLALVGALGAGVMACDFAYDVQLEPDDLQEFIAVHSVLVAGKDTVTVALTRTRRENDYWFSSGWAVSGASVRIIAGADTLRLIEQDMEERRCEASNSPAFTDAGCYLAVIPGGVRAGATYRLEIDIPGQKDIHGEATVPVPPSLSEPAPHALIEVAGRPYWRSERLDPVPVRWGEVPLGNWMELNIQTAIETCDVYLSVDRRFPGFSHSFSGQVDSVDIWDRSLHCDGTEMVGQIPGSLSLAAFDTAYTSYVKNNLPSRAVPLHLASAGVRGAIGVFAGVAVTTIPVTLEVLARGDPPAP